MAGKTPSNVPAPSDKDMWKRLLKRCHPDTGGDHELFLWIQEVRRHVVEEPELLDPDVWTRTNTQDPPRPPTEGPRHPARDNFGGFGGYGRNTWSQDWDERDNPNISEDDLRKMRERFGRVHFAAGFGPPRPDEEGPFAEFFRENVEEMKQRKEQDNG